MACHPERHPRAWRVIQSAPDLCPMKRRMSAKDLPSDSLVLGGAPPIAEASSEEILRAHYMCLRAKIRGALDDTPRARTRYARGHAMREDTPRPKASIVVSFAARHASFAFVGRRSRLVVRRSRLVMRHSHSSVGVRGSSFVVRGSSFVLRHSSFVFRHSPRAPRPSSSPALLRLRSAVCRPPSDCAFPPPRAQCQGLVAGFQRDFMTPWCNA